MAVHVTSEIGRMKSVLVHSPGPELLAVTPSTREDYLYDDIIDVEVAQREHKRFVEVLERFATVHHVRPLLAEVVERQDVRELLIRETMDIVPIEPLAKELNDCDPEELVKMLIEGREEEPGPLGKMLNETGYALPPMPNLFFTRDSAMGICDHVLIGSMRFGARWTEELIMKALFLAHPLLENKGILYDGSVERRLNHTLEGGDVHPLSRETLLIGFSERSSPAAIDRMTELVFENTPIVNVIVVVMPAENTAIHLDMIFTHVDHELCVVYPKHFIGTERLPVIQWRKGQRQVKEAPDLFSALKSVGLPMEPVFCGGDRRIVQDREQWSSGCNFAAIRPGLVLGYTRNKATIHEMEQNGFKVVSAGGFLGGNEKIVDGERALITFDGGELVRGGGGARCMSCPIEREDPWD